MDTKTAKREDDVRFLAIAGLIAILLVIPPYLATFRGPMPLPSDAQNAHLGRDFMNTWFYGRAFFDAHPGRFYDRATYEHALQLALPQNEVTHIWSYAPPFLLVAAPFGLLSYPVALAAWTILGLVALGAAVRSQGSRWLAVTVLTMPVTAVAIIFGQASLFATALLLVVFKELDRRPVLAGLALSLLALKPQPLILMPLFLIASRRWTVLAAALAGAVFLFLASVALNGWETWWHFIHRGLPAQLAEMKRSMDDLMYYSPTITSEAYQAGLPEPLIEVLQGLSTIFCAGLVAWTGWHSRGDGQAPRHYEGLIVCAASICATPYLLTHDLVALSTFLVLASYHEGVIRQRGVLLIMLYIPVLHVCMAMLGLHVLAALVLALTIWLVARAHGRAGPVAAASALAEA